MSSESKGGATTRLEAYEHVVQAALQQKYGPVRPPATRYSDEELIKVFSRPQIAALVAPIQEEKVEKADK